MAGVEGHPFWSVTVTVYVPGVLTLIDGVVALVDHKYPEPVLAVRITLDPCGSNMFPEGEIVELVEGKNATVMGSELAEHPTPFVTSTVKLPGPVA